ncbi:MAG TPA: type II toxin-antitoxin system prevent-host-death family antitoxin [Bryobacteraceae bacterium]|jgi:prevent-host-death family protein
MATRTVSATEFKAKCLALFDEVQQSGDSITVTKRGLPVAIVSPPRRQARARKSSMNSWAGRVKILGDIVHGDPSLWNVGRDAEER